MRSDTRAHGKLDPTLADVGHRAARAEADIEEGDGRVGLDQESLVLQTAHRIGTRLASGDEANPLGVQHCCRTRSGELGAQLPSLDADGVGRRW